MGVIVPLLWGVNVVSFLAHREREMEAGVYCDYPQHHFHVEIVPVGRGIIRGGGVELSEFK